MSEHGILSGGIQVTAIGIAGTSTEKTVHFYVERREEPFILQKHFSAFSCINWKNKGQSCFRKPSPTVERDPRG